MKKKKVKKEELGIWSDFAYDGESIEDYAI